MEDFLLFAYGLKSLEPESESRIRVGNTVPHWEEGKRMLFDDTFLHEGLERHR